MDLGLDGKRILCTGASHGLGKAIKKALEQEGAEVYDFSRSIGVDLMTDKGMKYAIDYLRKGYFYGLINNLGGGGTWDWSSWRDVMEKNFGITNQLTNEFLRNRKTGRVVNIVSIYGKEKGHNPIFTASKSAIIAYTKSLATQYQNTNITLNCIAPGEIDVGKPFPDKPKVIGKPEDVAGIVAFLCSNEAGHINGATISVDGGASHSW